ncbi:MAG: hypothetical protein ACRD0K_09470 [Egibacteraceae bacterium]
MRDLLSYGAGQHIPRYVALWLPLAPVMLVGLVALRMRRGCVVAIAVTTVPTLLPHNPPSEWDICCAGRR